MDPFETVVGVLLSVAGAFCLATNCGSMPGDRRMRVFGVALLGFGALALYSGW